MPHPNGRRHDCWTAADVGIDVAARRASGEMLPQAPTPAAHPEAIALRHYSRDRDTQQWGPLDNEEDRPKIVTALEKWRAEAAAATPAARRQDAVASARESRAPA